jgi:hypothetical protein
MKEVIKSNPNIQIADDLAEFCSLLEESKFIESEKIQGFTIRFYPEC